MTNAIVPLFIIEDRSPNVNDIASDGQIWFNRQGSIWLAKTNDSIEQDAPPFIWEQVAGEKGDKGDPGTAGADGATYIYELEEFQDAGVNKAVFQVAGIVEQNPTDAQRANINKYVGATGFVDDRADAVNVRGIDGTGSGTMLSAENLRKLADITETTQQETEAITDFIAGVINIDAGESFDDLTASQNNIVSVNGSGTIVIGLTTQDINNVEATIDTTTYPIAPSKWNEVLINGVHQQHNGYYLYFEGADENTHEVRNFGNDNVNLLLNYNRNTYIYKFQNQALLDESSIPTIEESKLSLAVRTKLNRVLNELTQEQIKKLAQLIATYSTESSDDISYLWKIGRATSTFSDYRGGKIPPQTNQTLITILVSEADATEASQLTSLQGNASLTSANISISGYLAYTANIPGIGSTAEPTEFSLSGTIRNLSSLTFSDLTKIGVSNLSQAVLDLINNEDASLPSILQYLASHISFNDVVHQSIATGTGIANLATALDLNKAVALLFDKPEDEDHEAVNEIIGDSNTSRISISNNIVYFFDADNNPYLQRGHIQTIFADNQPRFKITFEMLFSAFPSNPTSAQQENTMIFLRTTSGSIIPFIQIRDDNKLYFIRQSDSQAFQDQFGDITIDIPTGQTEVRVGISIEISPRSDGTFRIVPAVKIGSEDVVECNDINSQRNFSDIDGTFLSLANEWDNIKVGRFLAFGSPNDDSVSNYFTHNDQATILSDDKFAWGLITEASAPEIDVETLLNVKNNLIIESNDASQNSRLILSDTGNGLALLKNNVSKIIGEKRLITFTLTPDSVNRSGGAGTPHNAILNFNSPLGGTMGITLSGNDSNNPGFSIDANMYPNDEWLVHYWVCIALAVTNTSGGGGERISPVLYLNADAGANLDGDHGLDAGYLRNTNQNPTFRHWVLKHNFLKRVNDIRSLYPVVRITTQIADTYRIGYDFHEGESSPSQYPHCHVQFLMERIA